MPPQSRSNLFTGLLFVVFAAVVAFVWIPLDVETGIIEKIRRRTAIGDALAPSVAAFFIAMGGALLCIFERKDRDQPALDWTHIRFVGLHIAVLVCGFLIMLYAGPLAVSVLQEGTEYRLLRDTAPWKYIGYFLGGIVIIAGLISLAEGRVTGRTILISICVTIGLIAIYDLPFEDLLLPPNGDV